jgi:DNA-binding NtrC family response regulator
MADNRILIVSDSRDRHCFLEYHARRHGLTPIGYPNIMAARKAVRLEPFCMVVVDLSIPLEAKLALVKEACQYQENARVMTIGKSAYLKETGVLSYFPSVFSVNSIDSFVGRLKEYMGSQLQGGGKLRIEA